MPAARRPRRRAVYRGSAARGGSRDDVPRVGRRRSPGGGPAGPLLFRTASPVESPDDVGGFDERFWNEQRPPHWG